MDSRGIAAKKNGFDISYVQDVLGLAPKQIQNVNVLRDIRVRLQTVTFIDKCVIAAKYTGFFRKNALFHLFITSLILNHREPSWWQNFIDTYTF